MIAALSRLLSRAVRAIAAPDWLLNKVAACRGEPRYAMSVFRHYLVDHRQGAFAYGAPTQVVEEVTGLPAEGFETTARTYLAQPEAQRTGAAFRRVLTEFMIAPLWRGYDHDAYERRIGLPKLVNPLHAMHDEFWKADHAGPDGLATPCTARWRRHPASGSRRMSPSATPPHQRGSTMVDKRLLVIGATGHVGSNIPGRWPKRATNAIATIRRREVVTEDP